MIELNLYAMTLEGGTGGENYGGGDGGGGMVLGNRR